MKLVETQYGEDTYLEEYTQYDDDSLRHLCEDLISRMKEARDNGLTNVYAVFHSTFIPHSDELGGVKVQIWGERELNSLEKTREKEQERIQALADNLGVTFYEASVVDRLEKQKKIKL